MLVDFYYPSTSNFLYPEIRQAFRHGGGQFSRNTKAYLPSFAARLKALINNGLGTPRPHAIYCACV